MISDEAYAEALCNYLICNCPQLYSVSRLTQQFEQEELLTEELRRFPPAIILYDSQKEELLFRTIEQIDSLREKVMCIEMTEDKETAEAAEKIYYYLPMAEFIQQLRNSVSRHRLSENPGVTSACQMIGVYSFLGSPHTAQKAEKLAGEKGEKQSVLLLLIEEYADYAQADTGCAEGIPELIYYIQQNMEPPSDFPERMIQSKGSYDVIPPLGNPVDLHQVTQEQWEKLLQLIVQNTGYDMVLFVCGTGISGIFSILCSCNEIQIWKRDGIEADAYAQSLYTYAEMEGYPQFEDRADEDVVYG